MKLVVGLGNPGQEYAGTRHNAGFYWLDQLAEMMHVTFNAETKFHGLCTRTQQNGQECWLLQPQTFMNASGRSVVSLSQFFRIHPDNIIIVHDELDLPPGEARLKKGGGLGGHNGLKDIAEKLGTRDFWRLRIGIGHPGDRNKVVNYVLHLPGKEEAHLINQAVEKSLQIWPLIAQGDWQEAMHKLHTRR